MQSLASRTSHPFFPLPTGRTGASLRLEAGVVAVPES